MFRAGCGISLRRFLIIAVLSTVQMNAAFRYLSTMKGFMLKIYESTEQIAFLKCCLLTTFATTVFLEPRYTVYLNTVSKFNFHNMFS